VPDDTTVLVKEETGPSTELVPVEGVIPTRGEGVIDGLQEDDGTVEERRTTTGGEETGVGAEKFDRTPDKADSTW